MHVQDSLIIPNRFIVCMRNNRVVPVQIMHQLELLWSNSTSFRLLTSYVIFTNKKVATVCSVNITCCYFHLTCTTVTSLQAMKITVSNNIIYTH